MMLNIYIFFLVRREFCIVVPEANQHENRLVLVFILCNLVNLPLIAISVEEYLVGTPHSGVSGFHSYHVE